MKKYIVVHTHAHKNKESDKQYEFWEDPQYHKYKEKHGEHFCDKLAIWASKKMDNVRGEKSHSWTVEEVKAAFEKMGFKKPETATWGDIAYSANMAYADYFGGSIKTEADAVRYAYDDVSDPDGYPGKIFNRWLADIMGQNIEVSWSEYV